MMQLHRVFHNRQPEPCSAGCFGMAFVHTVEPLENTAVMLRCDADARISDNDCRFGPIFGQLHIHSAAVCVVFYCIVTEIVQNLIQQPAYTFDNRAAFHRYSDVFRLCRIGQCSLHFL